MMVKCGACRTQFDVPGAGRFSCPNCGSVNMVRDAAGGAGATSRAPGSAQPPPSYAPPPPGYAPPPPGYAQPPPGYAPPPPPAPEAPSPKLSCPECGFSFIVGAIEVATCPNCASEVDTGWKPEVAE